MHEQSETIQDPNGKYLNVYGRALPKAGQQLPGTPSYNTLEDAVSAAKLRSESTKPEDVELAEYEQYKRDAAEYAAYQTQTTPP